MAIEINPSYFGYPMRVATISATAEVLMLEGERRNLPQIQFDVLRQTGGCRPGGQNAFVTYRNGGDPPSAAESTAA